MSRRKMIPYAVSVALVALMPAARAAPTSATVILKNYLQAPAIASYNAGVSGFTVECWAQMWGGGMDAHQYIIRCVGPVDGNCGNTSVERWALWIDNGLYLGKVNWSIVDAGVCQELESTSGIQDGAYHHVAGTYDGATMRIYIDGVLDNSRSVSGLDVRVTGGEVLVGSASLVNDALHGQIDEVRIWSVARSQSQIASNMETEIAPVAGLVAYWQLNGNGIDLVDANTLVPVGTVPFEEGRLNQAATIFNPFILPPVPGCSDGIDNDGDGCADYPSDLGCSSPEDDSEEGGGCASPLGVPHMGLPASLVLVGPLMVLAVLFLRKKMAASSR